MRVRCRTFSPGMTALDVGLLIVRLAVGLTFAAHGAQKVLGWWAGPGFAGWTGVMTRMGLRPAPLWAAISAGTELFGGLLLALGFLTPVAAALVAAQSVYIVVRAHLPKGFWNKNGGIEFPPQLLARALLIVASGPGAIAIDPPVGIDLRVPPRAAGPFVPPPWAVRGPAGPPPPPPPPP